MAKLAILGFGTVGAGVLEVISRGRDKITARLGEELSVRYICDIRDFSQHPDAPLFVKDIEPILADETVQVVVETIGGATVAYNYVKRALKARRHVVTSNKELVAKYGDELIALARENGVCFLFEASVGGGIPVITTMHEYMATNKIKSMVGIVNGTTNFMLTRMEKSGASFNEALAEAQKLGYAETIDPSFDVDGLDAGRKIAILAALAYGEHIYPENIYTKGISGITTEDMRAAAKLGCAVKLLAYAKKKHGGELVIGVEPMLVSYENRLAGVNDVFNSVKIECNMLGEVEIYAKGAGKLPTASAVVADTITVVKEGVSTMNGLTWKPSAAIDGLYAAYSACDVMMRLQSEGAAKKACSLLDVKHIEGTSAVFVSALSQVGINAVKDQLENAGLRVEFVLKKWQ